MPITVRLPTALRQYADNSDTIELDGATAGDVLARLGERFPNLAPHLFNDDGSLRNFVNVFLDEDNIRDLDSGDTPVKDGDELTIVPSVAGGNGIGGDISDVELSKDEIERYSRHLIIPEVGMKGQKRMKNSGILLIGTGGLGSPLALYLAAAGIGRLGLVDFDVVDMSNLQRQIIHFTSDVGRPKLDSAMDKLAEINPHIQVTGYNTRITSANAMEIMEPYDLVIDGTDNFATRYLVNDACVLLGKANVYGSIFRFEGQASVFDAKHGPCYRCLYPEPPPPGLVPSCAEGGVLGILPGVIGLIQATEAIKMIIGIGEPLIGRLMLFNALTMKFRELKIRKDPACPVCGENPTVTELIDYEEFCGIRGEATEEEKPMSSDGDEISVQDLKDRLDNGADVFVLDVREPHEYEICSIPGSVLIPMGEVASRMDEINTDAEILVHCRTGGRSANITALLREQGHDAKNVVGGILAWADEIDPDMPKY